MHALPNGIAVATVYSIVTAETASHQKARPYCRRCVPCGRPGELWSTRRGYGRRVDRVTALDEAPRQKPEGFRQVSDPAPTTEDWRGQSSRYARRLLRICCKIQVKTAFDWRVWRSRVHGFSARRAGGCGRFKKARASPWGSAGGLGSDRIRADRSRNERPKPRVVPRRTARGKVYCSIFHRPPRKVVLRMSTIKQERYRVHGSKFYCRLLRLGSIDMAISDHKNVWLLPKLSWCGNWVSAFLRLPFPPATF